MCKEITHCRQMFLPYRNQLINMLNKSVEWFLDDDKMMMMKWFNNSSKSCHTLSLGYNSFKSPRALTLLG